MTDDEILAAYRALARYEGIFCEPASAASVAGVTKAAEAGEVDPDATVVCVLTGHGLKDPTTAERQVPPFLEAAADGRRGRRGARLVGRTMAGHWLAELDGSGVTVEVPASTANLGAGYDCLGLALALTNRIELEVRVWSRGEIELTVEGEGRNELTEDRENRFVRGLEAALATARGELPDGVGWRIAMHNQIPLARGLGSSAAATVGGRAGRQRAGRRAAVDVRAAAPRDRHRGPSRTTPRRRCSAGSSCRPPSRRAASRRSGSTRRATCAPSCSSRSCACRPTAMRAALPATVPLADAVANLGAVAVGVAGLATGRYDLLARLTVDRLHEPYRAAVYPQLPRLVEAAREAGALGRLPVGRRLDDPRLHRLDGRDHPDRGRVLRGRGRRRPAGPRPVVVAPRNAGARVGRRGPEAGRAG